MIKIPEDKLLRKETWSRSNNSYRFKKGKLFKDKEIKDLLARDYKKYNKQIIDLEKKFPSDEKPNF